MQRWCKCCGFKANQQYKNLMDAEEETQKELKIDSIVKKLRTLEGVIREEMDEIKWRSAYDRYSLFSIKAQNKERSPKDANEKRAMHTDQLGVSTQIINAETKLKNDDKKRQDFAQDILSSQDNIQLTNNSILRLDNQSKKQLSKSHLCNFLFQLLDQERTQLMNDMSSVGMSTINPKLQIPAPRRQKIIVSDTTKVPDFEQVAEMFGAATNFSAEPGPRNISIDQNKTKDDEAGS